MDRQRQDKLISTVSQTLTSAVHVKLEKVVKSEMKTHVTPGMPPCFKIMRNNYRSGKKMCNSESHFIIKLCVKTTRILKLANNLLY